MCSSDLFPSHDIGKSQVNNESTFKFLLSPEKASAYPERRNEPVYLTGRNYYDEQRNKEVSTKKSVEDLYDLSLGAALSIQTKQEREKGKSPNFVANTLAEKWEKAINGDAKAIKDIRDYFVNNKRVPSMTKAHLIIFEGLTEQDFTQKTYEYVASKFDEYINGFSDVNTNNSSTQKFMPTFDDVMTHLKGIHNLSSESFSDALKIVKSGSAAIRSGNCAIDGVSTRLMT